MWGGGGGGGRQEEKKSKPALAFMMFFLQRLTEEGAGKQCWECGKKTVLALLDHAVNPGSHTEMML